MQTKSDCRLDRTSSYMLIASLFFLFYSGISIFYSYELNRTCGIEEWRTSFKSGQQGIGKSIFFLNHSFTNQSILSGNKNNYKKSSFNKLRESGIFCNNKIFASRNQQALVISIYAFILILLIFIIPTIVYASIKRNLYRKISLKERELANANEEYKISLKNLYDGIITTDLSGNIKQMNPAAERLTGWTETEAKQKLLPEIFKIINSDTQAEIKSIQQILRENTNAEFPADILLASKNGKEIPILCNTVPIRDAKGEPAGIFIIFKERIEGQELDKVLNENQKEYPYLFHDNNFVMLLINPDTGSIFDANPAACSFYGYSHEELTSLKITDINQMDSEQIFDLMKKAKNEEKKSFIFKHKLANGELRDVEVYTGPIILKGMPYLYSIINDITKRKQAEEALRLSEDKFLKAFKTSPDSININRLSDGLYYEINEGFTKITGYSPGDVIGKTSLDINIWVNPDDRNTLIKNLRERGEINNLEAQFRMKNGKIRLGLMSARIIKINEELCILSITRDITEHKQTEENIKKLSRGIEQSPVIILITDINGNIEYTNPKFTEVTGYTFEEVKGKNPRILKSGNKSKKEYESLWNTILSKKDWHGEFLNKKKNRELYWELASISPILNERGEIINFIAVKEDITIRKKMTEELIEAKEKAEEMNRIKSYFFANMSHELRTPFVGIMGFSELLAESIQDPKDKEMAMTILRSSKRLTDTLNKILDITKLEFGKIDLQPSAVDVAKVIEEIVALYSKSAQQYNTRIKILNKIRNKTFITDEKLLNKILDNLVSNAVKFTKAGLIEITADNKIKNNHKYLILKVSDNGVGIPKEKLDIIWHEFRQASEGHSRSFEGTGLGLTITKKYVESMNGNISVKSEANEGSSFWVELPELNATADAEEELNTAENILKVSGTGAKNILYVEDDAIAVDFVQTVLKNIYKIEIAKHAEEALERLNKNSYDALLIDINLGQGMNGLELMKKIRKMPGHRTIPIVALTAYASKEDRDEFLSKGFSHYLSKPFSSKDLIELLENI